MQKLNKRIINLSKVVGFLQYKITYIKRQDIFLAILIYLLAFFITFSMKNVKFETCKSYEKCTIEFELYITHTLNLYSNTAL